MKAAEQAFIHLFNKFIFNNFGGRLCGVLIVAARASLVVPCGLQSTQAQ